MNLSIGNLGRRGISIFVMLQGSYMLFQMVWLRTYQSTSKSCALGRVNSEIFLLEVLP